MQLIYEPDPNEKTYEELLKENSRLKGKLSERHDILGWSVAPNLAMLLTNVYMFGRMLAFLMG